MAVRRKVEEEHENEERWLLTYADLITLLMAFFVIMYALSKVDAEKFQQLAITLSDSFHTPRTSPIPLPGVGGRKGTEPTSQMKEPPKPEPNTEAKAPPKTPEMTDLQKLGQQLQELIAMEGLGGSMTISSSPSGHKLYLRLSDTLLFEAGSAMLTPQAETLVGKIATIIAKAGKQVRVEGHTDDIPIHTAQFQSNWELSTARASSVIRYMIDTFGLSPQMLSASGYGEYRPVASNDTPEDRAKNRRVEFVITDEELKD